MGQGDGAKLRVPPEGNPQHALGILDLASGELDSQADAQDVEIRPTVNGELKHGRGSKGTFEVPLGQPMT
jgi:hypothetical protein